MPLLKIPTSHVSSYPLFISPPLFTPLNAVILTLPSPFSRPSSHLPFPVNFNAVKSPLTLSSFLSPSNIHTHFSHILPIQFIIPTPFFSLFLPSALEAAMSDLPQEHHESLMDKIHGHHDSSSSSLDDEGDKKKSPASPASAHVPPPEVLPEPEVSANVPSSMSSKIYRLFGREKPVHQVLGGGKPADVFLWRNKKISASALGVATVVWFVFELLQYHLLTLICYILIFTLTVLFLWSKASAFLNKAPPSIPDVHIPDNALREFISVLRFEINRALSLLRDIASGKELKKFLAVVAGLWILSIVGSWFNFLTLVYLLFVLLHTVPVLYEKYEDHVDSFAEKASKELKRQYAVADEKFLSKIPRGPLKDKKAA